MKNYIYPLAIAATLAATTSCNDEEVSAIQNIPDSQKAQISFSLSDESQSTRAGFTEAITRIVARIQSDEKGTSNALYTKTALKAAVDGTGYAVSYSTVSYYDGNIRYWDDAYGRKAQLSVYAVAIPNSEDVTKLTFEKLAGGTTWAAEATPNNSIQWDVTTTIQTDATLKAEDLVYSNNIQSGGKNGRYVWDYTTNPEGYPADNGRLDGHKDGQLVFTQKAGALESDAGHFDKGHLMFNHSLSRLTVKLIEGEDYTVSADDFKFNKGTGNIKLLSFPTKGTLNVKTGVWDAYTDANYTDINQMSGVAATASAAQAAAVSGKDSYSAQMLPGYKFYGTGTSAAKNVMQFVIDDNTYYVTQKQVFDALNITANTTGTTPLVTVENDTNGDYIEMKQGKNYKLSITVKKAKIDNVTATLAPWVEVAGSFEVNNAHIKLTLKTTGAVCDKDIDLYRLDDDNAGYDADNYDFSYQGKNWFGNYSTDAKHKTTLEHSALADGKWTTPWFFESNKTYYHFRTVNKGTTIEGTSDATNDYFNITAGPTASTDPHWGAPMQATSMTWLKYDESKGYEDHLHHAIGSTTDQIKIQELHMMSNINVVLKTPDDGGKIMLSKPAVSATYYADADEYNTAKGYTSGDPGYCTDFSSLTEEQKTKTPAEPSVETIVKITRIAANGIVEMGRGLVTPTAPYTAEVTMTPPSTYFATDGLVTNTYTYAVVPQSLSRDFTSESDDDYIGIFIQTPDHNQYYVVKKLSQIKATSVTDERNQVKDDFIKRWFPGHQYTYTFTITKKGIENITCTVADWVTVTGQNTNLSLED